MLEQSVRDFKIVQYAEFIYIFLIDVPVDLILSYLLVMFLGYLLYFDFVLALKSPPMITVFQALNVLIIDEIFL